MSDSLSDAIKLHLPPSMWNTVGHIWASDIWLSSLKTLSDNHRISFAEKPFIWFAYDPSMNADCMQHNLLLYLSSKSKSVDWKWNVKFRIWLSIYGTSYRNLVWDFREKKSVVNVIRVHEIFSWIGSRGKISPKTKNNN